MLFSYGQYFPEAPHVAKLIDQAAEVYLGVRDQEIILLTQNCLLLGCLRLFSAMAISIPKANRWLGGCTAFGLGDAAASCVGVFFFPDCTVVLLCCIAQDGKVNT